jgi:hypothetical protein
MPITFNCTCGKTLRVPDENAGKRVKCPNCGATRTVEAPAAPPDVGDDFEVIEDEPAPAPPEVQTPVPAGAAEEGPKRAKVTAALVEEAPPEPETPFANLSEKKKKKKRKKKVAAEGDDDSYEKTLENQKRFVRTVRGVSYLVVGILLVVGVAYIYLVHWEDVKFTGAKSVIGIIIFGLFGVAAIVKGLLGLAFGQFLGDDD